LEAKPMNIDFHYAAIKVLAHQAGFSIPDSQLIAYASQYVDDATAHKEVVLNKNPGVSEIRYINGEFDPICTAHKHLDYAKGMINRRSRALVYVCFHFIHSLEGTKDFSQRKVKRDGVLARELVMLALKEWKESKSRIEKRRALIKLGVALHSYADTWSHQGFSGYWDDQNNDISKLEIKNGAKWYEKAGVSTFLSYAAPNIGHAEAGTVPDRSEAEWRCKPSKRSHKGEKNCDEFLEASEKILELLSTATTKGKGWNGIRAKLSKCLMNPCDDDSFIKQLDKNEWRKQFPKLGFN
jgi:hypothetical protein